MMQRIWKWEKGAFKAAFKAFFPWAISHTLTEPMTQKTDGDKEAHAPILNIQYCNKLCTAALKRNEWKSNQHRKNMSGGEKRWKKQADQNARNQRMDLFSTLANCTYFLIRSKHSRLGSTHTHTYIRRLILLAYITGGGISQCFKMPV